MLWTVFDFDFDSVLSARLAHVFVVGVVVVSRR